MSITIQLLLLSQICSTFRCRTAANTSSLELSWHLIEARDLTILHARLLAGELDPKRSKPRLGRKVKDTDRSPSGRDFALIGSLAKELCTSDPKMIEAELRRRHPDYYTNREFVKYRQGGYWAYSIERFLRYKRDRLFRKPARILLPKAN